MCRQPDRRVGYGVALASRELRAVLAGQVVSIGGTSLAAVALTVVVFERTASPLLASLTFALGFLPYMLGGLLAGVVDRIRPRRLVTSCDAASAVLAAAMAWPGIPVPLLLALLLTVGSLSSVSGGARAALVRASVADDAYVPARSLLRIAGQCAQIGGNAAGGALLLALTPSGTLLLNAMSFAFSAATVRLVADYPNTREPSPTPLLRDALHGARAIFGRRELRRLLLVGWLAPMFMVAPEALAAPYVAAQHGSASQVGWWLIALPIGVIAGDLAGVRLLTPRQQRRLVAPALAASFVPYLAFAVGPPVPIALTLLVASGACGLYALGLDARVRDETPPGLFSRTMTLNSAGLMTLQGVGFVVAGATAQAIGPAAAIAVAGCCGLTSAVLLLRHDGARSEATAADAREPATGAGRPFC